MESGCLKNFDGRVGTSVERRVSNDELNFAGMAVDEILDQGIERPASLASWIEELDDPDLCLRGAICRRMGAIEDRIALACEFAKTMLFYPVVHVNAHAKQQKDCNR